MCLSKQPGAAQKNTFPGDRYVRGSFCTIHPVIFASKPDFANFPPTLQVQFDMQLVKLKPFCLNYFCVLRNPPKRTWTSVGRFAALLISKNQPSLAYHCHKHRYPRFQICIIRKITISGFYNSNKKPIASNIHIIPDHMFDLPQTVFHDMTSFDHF